jgi:3-deoxy-7-phosphoheptulonate synthase
MNSNKWSPSSWKNKFKLMQHPCYENEALLAKEVNKISALPPLVSIDEITRLRKIIAQASKQENFILQGGDCAESFYECSTYPVTCKIAHLTYLALTIAQKIKIPCTPIGRIAGQFAKPRSNKYEYYNNNKIEVFRGHLVNHEAFDSVMRKPDPRRLSLGWSNSLACMEIIRSNLGINLKRNLKDYIKYFLTQTQDYTTFSKTTYLTSDIKKLYSLHMLGKYTQLFTSHECLLLPYETATTRHYNNISYDSSAHMLWIGERTRSIDSAHVEYLSGVYNPIGIKVGPNTNLEELSQIIKRLNPYKQEGKIILIHRFGSKYIQTHLASLLSYIKKQDLNVTWMLDPMHGNTYTNKEGFKTRRLEDINSEIAQAVEVHNFYNNSLQGLHLEISYKQVSECTEEGRNNVLNKCPDSLVYESLCDPRLNYTQTKIIINTLLSMLDKEKNYCRA